MANSSMSLTGRCVQPFLDSSLFPTTGGYVGARLCMQVADLPGQPVCCLPCPATEWLYPDSFKTYYLVAEWLNVMGFVLLLFMLLSYLVLPVSQTRSHYLSTCLVVSIIMVTIGFIIPLAAQPNQCFNEITPNDMFSSMECAWSGGFLVAGGLSTTMWITLRAVSMNLQICWDIIPGRKFLYISQVLGWGIPAVLFVATMIETGVSFRFGNACHVNHQNALAVFWGPLLGMVGVAIISQIYTFGYCVRVYLKSLWGADVPGNSTSNSSGLPTYNGSLRAQTARAVLQRLKKVLFLQWRGLGIVSIIMIDVVFFAVVFIHVDALAEDAIANYSRTKAWVLCLVSHPDDKDFCTNLVNSWLINVETIEAVLFLFAFAGLQCFLMMVRPTFFPAWRDFFYHRLNKRREFISLDAHSPAAMRASSKAEVMSYERGHTSTIFEMQKRAEQDSSLDSLHLDTKSPIITSTLSSPDEAYKSPYSRHARHFSPAVSGRPPGMSPPITSQPSPPASAVVSGWHKETPEYSETQQRHNNASERTYDAPLQSFSATQIPGQHGSVAEVHSRGGLGLHPPTEVAESEGDPRRVVQWQHGMI